MRQLIGLLLVLLLGVWGATAVAQASHPQNRQQTDETATAPETAFDLAALSWQQLPAQRLPGAPFVVAAAADTCSDATTVVFGQSGYGETTVVNDMNDTPDPNDPDLTCIWGNPPSLKGYRTVWYRFTPANNGRVIISTANNFNENRYDTVLAVYTGSCASLNPLACNDDHEGFSSRLSFTVNKNVTYFVEVADWNEAVPGQLELDIFFVTEPINTRWQSLPANAPARTRHATVAALGDIFLLGGQTNASGIPEISREVHRYDPATDTWVEVAEMPQPGLTELTAAFLNDRIYVPGGYNGNSIVGTHYAYNVLANVWETSPKPPPPTPVIWSQAIARPNGAGYYLVGGIANREFFSSAADARTEVSFYNISSNSWDASPADLPEPRYGHTAVWLNNGICVTGGLNDTAVLLSSTVCSQPVGGSWQSISANLNVPRYGANSAVGPDGKWYVFGGLDASSQAISEVEVYDPNRPGMGWQVLDISYDLGGSANIRPRAWVEGEFVDDYLYAVGGNDTTDFFVTPLVQRLFVTAYNVQMPVIFKNYDPSLFDDNFKVAQPLALNVAKTQEFDPNTDFFDAYTFYQPNTSFVTVRLSQIPLGSNYDVFIYDSQKRLLNSGDNAGSLDEAVTLFLPAGRYYVMVERIFGPSEGSRYRLIVEK